MKTESKAYISRLIEGLVKAGFDRYSWELFRELDRIIGNSWVLL